MKDDNANKKCYIECMNQEIFYTPKFNRHTGYLYPGIYIVKISELLEHPILCKSEKRKNLILSLKEACEIYWQFNIPEIFVDGSFASLKEKPEDIDGYIVIDENSKFDELVKSGSIWGDFSSIDKKTGKFRMWKDHKIEFYVHPIQKAFYGMSFPIFFTNPTKYVNKGIFKIIK